MKRYLIAYVNGYNDRVLTETVYSESQRDAICKFELEHSNYNIIAITIIEEGIV